jgi:hypothetical protein
VLVPNGLPEALVMASATSGYRENGEYGELGLRESTKMMHRGKEKEEQQRWQPPPPTRWFSDEIELSGSGEQMRQEL